MMKKAIIHEWLVSYAGSEKCVESFVNLWPEADVFALVDFLKEKERQLILKGNTANTSFIQKMPFAGKFHRHYLPLFPLAIEQFDLSSYDVIVSSSHAVAKGVLTNSNQLHICYCHTPMRYAWDLYHQYLREANLTRGLKAMFIKMVLHYLRMWDLSSAGRVDHFIANSHYIARRIKKTYGRSSDVIYPPVDVEKFPLETNKEDYYLTASRLVPYKKIDIIAEAFSRMPDKKLIIIGDGPEMPKVKAKSSRNIEILGYQSDEALSRYMQQAKAFVFAAEEDFGIVVVEALACGTPVIAYNKGGAGETVIDGRTGMHFNSQEAGAIVRAVKDFEARQNDFDYTAISRFAGNFSRRSFEEKINCYVNEKYDNFVNHIHNDSK